jgi:hypothetical protein
VIDHAGIERAVEALSKSLVDAGVEPMRAPLDSQLIERIEAAVAPLRLPAQARRFWELVDPTTIRVHPHPDLIAPEFALTTWERHVNDAPGMVPRVLFPVGYESWTHLLIELHGPESEDGGAMFSWAYGGQDFRFVFGDMAGMIDALTSAVIEKRVERRGDHLYLTGPSWVDEAPGVALHPVFGAIDLIPEALAEWPEPWQLRSGITPDRRRPLGADHTIAEVFERLEHGPVSARIHARVLELGGGAEGARVTVTDGTGRMRIWCPASTTALGPGIDGTFEFHIRAPAQDVPESPDFTGLENDPIYANLPIDMGGVVRRLTSATSPVDATATDIRATEPW